MLVDILRMPPVTHTLCDEHLPRLWRQGDHQFELGVNLSHYPTNLYKAVYLAHDSSHVFESVFEATPHETICLYTKSFGLRGTDTGVSLNALVRYHAQQKIRPVMDIFNISRLKSISDYIIPIINSQDTLDTWIHEDWLHVHTKPVGWPLYCHAPVLLEAMLEGRFSVPPFRQIFYPGMALKLLRPKWSRLEMIIFSHHVQSPKRYVHCPQLNDDALKLFELIAPSFEVSTSIPNALEGVMDLWTVNHIDTRYLEWVEGKGTLTHLLLNRIADIAYAITSWYVRSMKSGRVKPTQKVTIVKTSQDEITIEFSEIGSSDIDVFYFYLPVMALETMAIGPAI